VSVVSGLSLPKSSPFKNKKASNQSPALKYHNGLDGHTVQLTCSTATISAETLIKRTELSSNKDEAITLRSLDLPRHSPRNEVLKQNLLLDLEIVVGRIAMIASFLFFAVEFCFGLSTASIMSGGIF
jgi:hypothetical protein